MFAVADDSRDVALRVDARSSMSRAHFQVREERLGRGSLGVATLRLKPIVGPNSSGGRLAVMGHFALPRDLPCSRVEEIQEDRTD
jgi:hypothetical protein